MQAFSANKAILIRRLFSSRIVSGLDMTHPVGVCHHSFHKVMHSFWGQPMPPLVSLNNRLKFKLNI